MSKTITIIQLLNKIANREEVPIEIEYMNKRYILNRNCKQYYEKGEGSYLDNKLAFKNTIEYEFYGDFLNSEVKIIEEQEEINKLEIDENGFIHTNNGSWKGRKLDIAFAESINKLAEEIKNIKEMK